MEFTTFINNNWETLLGILSFVFTCGYVYNGVRESSKLRESDYKAFELKLKEQKEIHDEKINEIQIKQAANEVKIDELKDKTFTVISAIQQDIREIMTILKRDK